VLKTYYIFLAITFICLGCVDQNRYAQPVSCPDLPAFVVDLSTPSFFGVAWLWLNNQEKELVHEELLNGTGSATQFVNFQDACEEHYTVSIGVYNELISSGGGVTKEINIEEVSGVPSGLGLDIFPRRRFQTVNVFTEESTLTILHCPPVDSVRYAQLSMTIGGVNPPVNFSYNTEDSILLVYPGQVFSRATEEVLAIRLAGTDDWRGKMISIPTPPNSLYEFTTLDTFTLQTLVLAETETTALIIIKIITNLTENKTTELARNFGNSISFPAPAVMDGILLYVNTENYEEQSFHSDYPTSLPLSRSLSVDNIKKSEDQFEIQASGGDVIRLIKDNRDTAPDFIGKRIYTLPALEGLQTCRLPEVGRDFQRRDASIAAAFELSFLQGGTLELIRYPLINGDYDTYLSKIISTAISRDWLVSQQYEKLSVEY
jgi:hypothetical protein